MRRWIAALIVCAWWHGAQADDLKVAFNMDKPPYSYRNAAGFPSGIHVDLMRAALGRLGLRMEPVDVPRQRLLQVMVTGEADVSTSVVGKDESRMVFSAPFLTLSYVAISRKSSHVRLDSLHDLDRYRFVIWQRGWGDLGPAFEARYKPDANGRLRSNYLQSASQDLQMRVFLVGRADVIVIDKTVFDWFSLRMGGKGLADDTLEVHNIVQPVGLSAAFKQRDLRDKFNAVIRDMRADGSYQAILNSYR